MKKSLLNRLLACAICATLCLFLCPITVMAAEDTRNLSFEESLAADLKQLGLIKGVSDTDFDLESAPTRTEALVMLIRSLGKEDEATSGSFTHPFTDVVSWADPYVGYAYENRLTNGVSQTLFGSDETCNSNMYLTFILRALGYSDGSELDFTWENPYILATSCRILPYEVDSVEFLRADVVLVSYAALMATLKNSTQTLAEKLITADMFTQTQYDTYIDEKAFSDLQALDSAISKAIVTYETGGNLSAYYFDTESHIVLKTTADGDTVKVFALVCYCVYHFSKDNSSSGSKTANLVSITVHRQDDGSYETVDYWDLEHTESDPSADFSSKFSAAVWEKFTVISGSLDALYAICDARAETYRTEVFEFYRPTFEEALAEVCDLGTVIKQLMATNCTVVYCVVTGVPHSPYFYLDLVWFDGNRKELPLPKRNGWGAAAELDDIYLSEDKNTLYYQVTFDERMVMDEGLPFENVIHEKGTYNYSVDLVTGDVSMTITDE